MVVLFKQDQNVSETQKCASFAERTPTFYRGLSLTIRDICIRSSQHRRFARHFFVKNRLSRVFQVCNPRQFVLDLTSLEANDLYDKRTL